MPQIPPKCQDLRIAGWMPWWCHLACTRTGTRLCYWACKPIGRRRTPGRTGKNR